MVNHVFSYGVLMFPELVYALTGKNFHSDDAILEGYARYSSFDPKRKGKFGPVVLPGKGGEVKGKILWNLDIETIGILNKFEMDYKEEEINVIVNKKSVKVLFYSGSKFDPKYLIPGWDPNKFLNEKFEYYRDKMIPQFRKNLGLAVIY